MRITWIALALALLVAPAAAGQDKGTEAFERAVFAPDLVLRHSREIGLTAEQRRTITDELKKAQVELAPLQIDLSTAGLELLELLDHSRVDEAAAVAKTTDVLQAEREVKKRQMVLLVRIKNALTPEQQERLRAIRDGGRRGEQGGDASTEPL
ncbi:MAG: hypothetical protein R2909_11115 [Gemmatimonadales bacterium]